MTDNANEAAPAPASGAVADPAEVAKFEAVSTDWRRSDGPFAPLHAMQPVRLSYLRDHLAAGFARDPSARAPLSGLRVLDLGCGGGLASEPMARLGAQVVGMDPSSAAVDMAARRAASVGLPINYHVGDAAAAADAVLSGAVDAYDAVVALEVVEHAADRDAFAQAVANCVRPGGLAVLSTLNRTAASFLGAIVAAEYALGWLPRGTHDWRKFPTPDELAASLEAAGLTVVDRTGFVFEPLARRWRRDPARMEINFALVAERPA